MVRTDAFAAEIWRSEAFDTPAPPPPPIDLDYRPSQQ
jgi:hypothetical protein